MSRFVWLNGGFVDPAGAGISIDDPGFRHGVGLFETMRADAGVVTHLERHLARLERSRDRLGLDLPPLDAARRAIVAVAARIPEGTSRIRATLTPHPTLLVEGAQVTIPAYPTATALSLRGLWHPDRSIGEHKTLSFLPYTDAQRRAEEAGADTALLLDHEGRLGEAARANVFCVVAGTIVTAPVHGLLPGTTRALVIDLCDVREDSLPESVWREADEIFLTSAVTGVAAVTALDGVRVGAGGFGPVAARVAVMLEAARSPR